VQAAVRSLRGEANLRVFISEYYKNKLFRQPEPNFFSMVEENTNDIPQILTEESEFLTANFTEVEVKEAIMQLQRNKAPGPDGLPAEFYQVFWELQTCELPMFSLNFGVITLLPKKEDASRIEQY
jgi:hypothetical protein